MQQRILDIHPHVISPDTDKYPRAPLGGNASGWSRARPATAEQLVAAMEEAGVAGAAIVQSSTCYGYDNAYVADTVAAHPDRFTGVFSIDVLAEDAPRQIRHWVDRKLSGLRLFTTGSTMSGQADWLADARSFPAWECAAELGIPVCVQMRPEGVPQLEVLLERFPGVRVILDHLMFVAMDDGPPYAAAGVLFRLAEHENVFLKLTTSSVRKAGTAPAAPDTFFPELVKHFGADRIAWGSNFPASEGSLKEMVGEAVRALSCLPDADRARIFGGTAETLYPALRNAGK
ncbi:Amidohydrolase [Pigmentiphaga humi]|uniref:Amidohydrolase n=1 Tax=Pigmentiphaga humi TaxID=2478468 RepID=A0A3P4AXU6_9BURK|nr:amidohydrolase family protein [Pigmentiphaga humi]VCU68186.1 Amidohydrolase [Pigmentiphaga humi]